jgi:hypothetical protein
MNLQPWSNEKLVETWLRGLEEPLDDAERAELNRALAEQPHLRERLILLAQEQSWLMWHGAADDEKTPADSEAVASEGTLPAPIEIEPEPDKPFHPGSFFSHWFPKPFGLNILAIAIGFFVGALAAGMVVRGFFLEYATGPITTDPFLADNEVSRRGAYAATLVDVTNCRWETTGGSAEILEGNNVRPGQVLRLVEGIAEISSTRPHGGSGRFVLEGPLAMVMTGDGTPTLQYGRLFAAIDPKGDEFLLGTPLGQVTVDGSASMGVVASGEDVMIHVFAGSVTFELLWSAETLDEDQFKIAAGASLRLTSGKNGTLNVQRGNSNERSFIASVPMTEDRLTISDRYVSTVRQARPLAYWRFESDSGRCVRNEVADRLHLKVHGGIGWRDYPGNRSAELGNSKKSGYLLTDDSFDSEIQKAYSVEAWVKPSHIHSGSIVGFLDWSDETPLTARHGILLDLCGPAGPWAKQSPSSLNRAPIHPAFHPQQLRFLQRVPPNADANLGTSCFSPRAYECRKWQHFAGVKDGKSLKLFINGELVSQEQDENDAPSGLRVLVGQVWPTGIVGIKPSRQFAGELDEIAVYDRALDRQELAEHFRLGHEASSNSATTH